MRDELERAELESTWDLPDLQQQVQVMRALGRSNPMLGTRGAARHPHPEINAMQVQAIARAARR